MNSKNSSEKPWENININEIQPYPSNYLKTVVLSYILGVFMIVFKVLLDLDVFSKTEYILVLLSQTVIYGVISFSLLYLYSDGHKKFMLSTLKRYLKFLMVLILIFIMLLIYRIGVAELLKCLTSFYILGIFSLICAIAIFNILGLFLGPITLIETEHPQGEIHGVITTIITVLVIIFSFKPF